MLGCVRGSNLNFVLFTRSTDMEDDLINNIHQLGHEVFCSRKLIDDLLNNYLPRGFFEYFEGIIFSESISNKEMFELAQKNYFKEVVLYRKMARDTSEKERVKCQGNKINILSDSLTGLREDFELSSRNKVKEIPDKTKVLYILKQKMKLSRQEFQILQKLISDEGCVVSKEQLSKVIWKESSFSHSNRCRISTIVKNIRTKLLKLGISEECIQTVWGQGYQYNGEYIKLKKII